MDRRIIKTKRLICNVFTELLAEKDMKSITITELANRAEINRKTIYAYYNSVEDILGEIEDTLIKNMELLMNEIDFNLFLKNPNKVFESLTEILKSNLDFYSKLMRIEANSQLVNKLVKLLKGKLKAAFLSQNFFENDDVDYITNYVVSGMLASYQYWFNTGMRTPIDEFSKKISSLVYSGIDKFITK